MYNFFGGHPPALKFGRAKTSTICRDLEQLSTLSAYIFKTDGSIDKR